jgi:hypothetical protein
MRYCSQSILFDYGAEAAAAVEGVNRIVGLVDTVERVSDEMINGKFITQVSLDQSGDIPLRFESTKGRTLPDTYYH